ncbi:hypothetical protein [Marinicrinis lubricantis]|uniref:Class IIb bacteriocin, lactobin A/cerein 7B family n=1 Tax=Marinicrinis lubricantis TaxID=2086470 RepID=A0ABW1IVF9_9BACL
MEEMKFIELSELETRETTGGAIWGVIAGAAVGYLVYELADTVVERYTGDTIPEHVSNGIGYGIEKIGEGLQHAGNFISGR